MNEQHAADEPLDAAFAVLTRSVAESTHAGHVPRASQVRLAMKRLTYDGFDPSDFGFKRFRDFLAAAVAAGVIEIRDRPGDVEVLPPPNGDELSATDTKQRVRRDIWRSFVDWNPETLHFIDLNDGRAIEIPRRPVDLEPPRFTEIRNRLASQDEFLVAIPSIPVAEQTRWMRAYSDGVTDSALRNLLIGALADDKPAKSFTSIVRADVMHQRQWNQFFGERVLRAVTTWIQSDPRLAAVEVFEQGPVQRPAEAPEDFLAEMTTTTRNFIDTASRLLESGRDAARDSQVCRPHGPSDGKVATAAESRLRQLVHRAVDRMSEDELRALRIPVGSLLDDA